MTALGAAPTLPATGAVPEATETPLWVGGSAETSRFSAPESPLVKHAIEVRAALREATRVLRADWLHYYGEELGRSAARAEQEQGSARVESRTPSELDADASIAHGRCAGRLHWYERSMVSRATGVPYPSCGTRPGVRGRSHAWNRQQLQRRGSACQQAGLRPP